MPTENTIQKIKRIKLTKGKYTIVDTEDYDYLNQWKWHINRSSNCPDYAVRNYCVKKNGKVRTVGNIFMHRVLLKVKKGQFTDHINGNGLDNRKSNLRIATLSQNQHNKKPNKNNLTGYKGVRLTPRVKSKDRYEATLFFEGKHYYQGTYDTAKEAAEAYNKIAVKLFGEYAKLNNI